MNAVCTSVVVLYESEGLTPAQIGSEEGLEEIVVKSILVQYSNKYRDDVRESSITDTVDNEIRDDELAEYLESYKMLRFAEEEHIKERVLRNLINYKKNVTDGIGANDPKKMLDAMKVLNPLGKILELNKRLEEMREAKRTKMLENSIDVELAS